MLTPCPALPAPTLASLTTLGHWLRARGFSPGRVSRALGILAWNGPDLDGEWWARDNHADGDLGALVDLFVRGQTLPVRRAEALLPPEAWGAGVLVERRGDVLAEGIILPLGADLVWTDRGDRSFHKGGLFLPDSTSLELRRLIPPQRVRRHLDLGAGGGAITVAAARRSEETVALDINPRGGEAVQRTMALSNLTGAVAYSGEANEAVALGRFDRLSFVLPLLVPWHGMASAGPEHTISASSDLLVQVLESLPSLISPGGLVLLYTQDWAGGPPLPKVLDLVMEGRAWRGAYWWDQQGMWGTRPVRTGCLALRLDGGRGWVERQNVVPDEGVDDWWPHMAEMLGERGVTS